MQHGNAVNAAGRSDGRPVEDVHAADAAVRYYADELDVLEHYLCSALRQLRHGKVSRIDGVDHEAKAERDVLSGLHLLEDLRDNMQSAVLTRLEVLDKASMDPTTFRTCPLGL